MIRHVTFCKNIFVVLFLLSFLLPQHLNAQPQPECTIEPRNLSAYYDTAKVYPSMTPRSYIKVGYGSFQEPPYKLENLKSPDTWVIRKRNDPKTIKPERIDLTIADGVAYLYFSKPFLQPSILKNGDKLEVGIKATMNNEPICIMHKEPVTVEDTDSYTLQITPGVVPNQEMNDGTKKTVGHFNINLDVPSLVSNENIARFYIKSDNLFSTEGEDKTTKVEFKLGAERSLIDAWYVPFNIEGEIIGNQTFANASFVASGGIKTILPWGWTKPALYNGLVQAPISPEFKLSAQYENRFKQNIQNSTSHANSDSFRAFGQISWNPVYLFPEKISPPNNISLEFLAKGWWFPYEKTSSGDRVNNFEGRLEASLLVPLTTLSIGDDGNIKTKSAGATSRIRIKYSSGANETNGFSHSSEFTFAVEVLN